MGLVNDPPNFEQAGEQVMHHDPVRPNTIHSIRVYIGKVVKPVCLSLHP